MDLDRIKLSIENLNEIHEALNISYEKAQQTHASIDFDEEIAPTPEKRKWLNLLMDSCSQYLYEISHIDSFLQYCDFTQEPLNEKQHKTLVACQQLCQYLKNSSHKVLKWVVETKAKFNEAECSVSQAIESNNDDSSIKNDYDAIEEGVKVSPSMLEDYQQYRDIYKEIHKDLIFIDPENMMNTAGRRLKVLEGKKMYIETEQEMNVVVDYGLFQYQKEGRTIPERYYRLHHHLYSGKKLQALIQLKEARFSLLRILEGVEQHGIIVKDDLTHETLLMIDKGIHQVARKHKNYAVLTHYIQTSEFVMTTGASTPVALDCVTGKKMWEIYERLIGHHQNNAVLDRKTYLQCITDLFKMAIHENLVKQVASLNLPMNYHGLYHHAKKH